MAIEDQFYAINSSWVAWVGVLDNRLIIGFNNGDVAHYTDMPEAEVLHHMNEIIRVQGRTRLDRHGRRWPAGAGTYVNHMLKFSFKRYEKVANPFVAFLGGVDNGGLGCHGCKRSPATWTVSIPTLLQGNCDLSTLPIFPITLPHVGACEWRVTAGTCPSADTWRLRSDGVHWFFTVSDDAFIENDALYVKAIAEWRCLAPNVMSFAGGLMFGYTNWPLTIDLYRG